MTWKSYVIGSGAGVVATYLISTPMPRTDAPTLARPAASRMEVASDIEEQAVRLQSRLRRQAPYQEPARNPFRFSQRRTQQPAAPVETNVVPTLAESAPALPQVPMISLVGIAENADTGRTGIIKTDAGIVFVRAGDSVGEYTVRTIDENAIDLVGTDGAVRRLAP